MTDSHKSWALFHKGRIYYQFTNLKKDHSALEFLTTPQVFVILSFLLISVILVWRDPANFLIVTTAALTLLYFTDLLFHLFVIVRSLLYQVTVKIKSEELHSNQEVNWPFYTILCPLYREAGVLPQFVEAMRQLDYPPDKLQILLLLEQNDRETFRLAQKLASDLPFDLIIVPHTQPKTKPKACNYGLNFARGEYVVIYDAEDVPAPDQLKKAVLAFRKAPSSVQCAQARLTFYNPRQNLLTKFFSLEYGLWFGLILTGYQSIDAPIPLGGTSNHFRTRFLRRIQAWDAFNVTEDCDLGIRLARLGYKTVIFNSSTREEATSSLGNWLLQRSRWIKGYMQTFFVHNRQPLRFLSQTDTSKFWYFQLIVGVKVFTLLVNPFMWALTVIYFVARARYGPFIESIFPPQVFYFAVTSAVLGNFLYLYLYMIAAVKNRQYELIMHAYLIPLYWLLMSFAAYRALAESLYRPHYWHKTSHGLHLKEGSIVNA